MNYRSLCLPAKSPIFRDFIHESPQEAAADLAARKQRRGSLEIMGFHTAGNDVDTMVDLY